LHRKESSEQGVFDQSIPAQHRVGVIAKKAAEARWAKKRQQKETS
jgi:hypothetical protein